MISCYLDTSFLSAFVRKNIHDRYQLQTIIRIHSFWKQGYIKCFVSEAVKRELENIPQKYKEQNEALVNLYMLMDKAEMFPTKIAYARWGEVLWGEGQWGAGVEKPDPVFQVLANIFSNDDAEHIFLCIKNGIPYFLTYDLHSILNRANQHSKELNKIGIKILSPKDFENNLG